LLAWFQRYQRPLPWRSDRDPYRICVSEVMLQQTQVATVVPYFERFLQAFPTIDALATADEGRVLKLWEGLGYYRRARDLHRAARQLVAEHGGALPDDPTVVARLPGVGRYTLGAVLSQAYDRPLPILEANSERVLCRLLGIQEDPRNAAVKGRLWQAADTLLPRRRVGDFNQALMELGALVCTPGRPDCAACPVAALCEARRRGIQDQLPVRGPAAVAVDVAEAGAVVRRGDRFLLVRRPPSAPRWAGLWEFPHDILRPGEAHEQAAARLIAELTGVRARVGAELTTVRHGVTRFRIRLVCFEARYRSGAFASPFYDAAAWVTGPELAAYPLGTPQRRVARALLAPGRQRSLF
jgi:A/G-specific adenine glycosylase